MSKLISFAMLAYPKPVRETLGPEIEGLAQDLVSDGASQLGEAGSLLTGGLRMRLLKSSFGALPWRAGLDLLMLGTISLILALSGEAFLVRIGVGIETAYRHGFSDSWQQSVLFFLPSSVLLILLALLAAFGRRVYGILVMMGILGGFAVKYQHSQVDISSLEPLLPSVPEHLNIFMGESIALILCVYTLALVGFAGAKPQSKRAGFKRLGLICLPLITVVTLSQLGVNPFTPGIDGVPRMDGERVLPSASRNIPFDWFDLGPWIWKITAAVLPLLVLITSFRSPKATVAIALFAIGCSPIAWWWVVPTIGHYVPAIEYRLLDEGAGLLIGPSAFFMSYCGLCFYALKRAGSGLRDSGDKGNHLRSA